MGTTGMAEAIFEFVADSLEQATDLDKLEARGTLRIALKQAGLDARTVGREQMEVAVLRALPAQLATRGVEAPDAVCRSLVTGLKGFAPAGEAPGRESPEDVFGRLGRR